MAKKAPKNPDATTELTTRQDPEDGFIRTAIVVANEGRGGSGDTGSLDLVRIVDGKVERVGQINISYGKSQADNEEYLIVDVIDVDDRFTQRRALHFTDQRRHVADLGPKVNLVSTDFRRRLFTRDPY